MLCYVKSAAESLRLLREIPIIYEYINYILGMHMHLSNSETVLKLSVWAHAISKHSAHIGIAGRPIHSIHIRA